MKFLGGIIEISSTKIGQYPGDKAGDSIISTIAGTGEKGETAQVYGMPGFISNPPKGVKGLRIRVGSVDLIIGALNYSVPLPSSQGETKLYSTDSEGEETAKVVLTPSGKVGIKSEANSEDLKTVISDLITEIQNLVTTGSPTTHTVSPTSVANLTAINTRLSNVMEAL